MARRIVPPAIALVLAAAAAAPSFASTGGISASPISNGSNGGTSYGGAPLPAQPPSQPQPQTPAPQPPAQAPLTSAPSAVLSKAGVARAPRRAPLAVRLAIAAANQIRHRPYRWGGGHGSFTDTGYDCSGAVSYLLHGAGLLASPLNSTGFMSWGLPGPGRWITVYANAGHAYAMVAGLRLDTSGGPGPRWHALARTNSGFVARHPAGL